MEPRGYAPLAFAASGARRPTLADVAVEVAAVPGAVLMADVERLFHDDKQLRGVAVHTRGGVQLLTREHLMYQLIGRLGYGRALNTRTSVDQLFTEESFVLAGDLSVAEAAQRILERPERVRYRDFLVHTESGLRAVSVSHILERASEVYRYAALHDHLTELPNRRGLDERWADLTSDHVQASRIAVLYIDLDSFKAVNDTFGHGVGDEILRSLSQRLPRCVRSGDIVARVGGDEFAALLIDVNEAQALAAAERVVQAANEPFIHDDQPLHLSASVGIAMASDVVRERELSQLEVLLRHADGAMLKAKSAGKCQVGRLDGVHQTAPFAREASIRRRLNEALSIGAFTLHYQPKLDLATGSCGAVEALIRWDDPELGMVSPAEFIPIAETTDQIHRIGSWVVNEACRQGKSWLEAGTPRTIAINISPVQFATHTLVAELLAALTCHGLPPELLRVEITEGAAIADLPRAIEQLDQLRAAGIEIDLDDFGTGHSSLAMLRYLPLSAVKIDKAFIDNIDTTPADAMLVRGVIDAAHALGLSVIAEGVERAAQLQCLKELGCDTIQGFLISRPVAPLHLKDIEVFCDCSAPNATTFQ